MLILFSKFIQIIKIRQIAAADTWELRHRVMWPKESLDFVKLANDTQGIHYGLFENNIIISVISVFIENNEAQFRKFATDSRYQGRGYGSKLLKHLIEQAKALSINYLYCDARKESQEFYEKFGLKKSSAVFQKNGRNYIKMGLNINN